MHEPAISVGAHHVDVGAGGNVGGLAQADFEINRHPVRSINHVMAVAGTFRKGRAIAGAEHRLAAILDQCQFTFEHIGEFVFVRMPVALARPITRRQTHEIDPEIVVDRLRFEGLRKSDSIDDHRYLTAIHGPALDHPDHVSHAVDRFTLPTRADTEKAVREDLLFDPNKPILFFDDIERAIEDVLPTIHADLNARKFEQQRGIEAIAKAHGIPSDIVRATKIGLTDNEEQITEKFFKKQAEALAELSVRIKQLFEALDQLDPADENYQAELEQKSSELLDLIPEQNKQELIRHVEKLTAFLGFSPDTATGDDLRRFQQHQVEQGAQPPKLNSQASALRFFFTVTLGRTDLTSQLARTHYPRKLPRILSPDDVLRLLEAAPGPGPPSASPMAPACAAARW